MEVAVAAAVPTYSGGLGVLAGDAIRAAADAGYPLAGVTLLYREGYFRQHVSDGRQHEAPQVWQPDQVLARLDVALTLPLHGRDVRVRAWRYDVRGVDGAVVPVYFLDTDVEGNDEDARALTRRLYGGDARYRLEQEALLGLGGVALLRALGHDGVATYHMNEGHAALLVLALLDARGIARAGSRALRLHHPHARPGRPRPLRAGAGRSGARCRPRRRAARVRPARRRGRAQHDAARAARLALRQRRRHAPRRGLAGDVPRARHRGDHQRRPRRHLGRAAAGRALRPPPAGLAARQRRAAPGGRDSARGAARGPRRGQGSDDRADRAGPSACASTRSPSPSASPGGRPRTSGST